MCDDEVHPRRVRSPSRRTVGLWTATAALAPATGRAAGSAPVERDVEVRTADGNADAALFHPGGEGRWPAVLVWTDVLSLREAFRMIGRRLASAGHVVLIPNVYYRVARAPVVEPDFDFGRQGAWDRLVALSRGLDTPGAAARDAAAYLAFLDDQPQTARDRRAGVQGYCMGGALALRTAATHAARIGAVASFHGGGLATDKATSPHLSFGSMRAEVLIAVARDDDAREPAAKDQLKAALAETKTPGSVEVYAASHGWCVPDSDVYDARAANRAWNALADLYGRRLV